MASVTRPPASVAPTLETAEDGLRRAAESLELVKRISATIDESIAFVKSHKTDTFILLYFFIAFFHSFATTWPFFTTILIGAALLVSFALYVTVELLECVLNVPGAPKQQLFVIQQYLIQVV